MAASGWLKRLTRHAMMPGMPATLRVFREDPWNGRFRKMPILVNGKPLLAVPSQGSAETQLNPGQYELSARMDWVSSAPLTHHLEEGREYHLHTELPDLFRILYQWRTAITLRHTKTI